MSHLFTLVSVIPDGESGGTGGVVDEVGSIVRTGFALGSWGQSKG